MAGYEARIRNYWNLIPFLQVIILVDDKHNTLVADFGLSRLSMASAASQDIQRAIMKHEERYVGWRQNVFKLMVNQLRNLKRPMCIVLE